MKHQFKLILLKKIEDLTNEYTKAERYISEEKKQAKGKKPQKLTFIVIIITTVITIMIIFSCFLLLHIKSFTLIISI